MTAPHPPVIPSSPRPPARGHRGAGTGMRPPLAVVPGAPRQLRRARSTGSVGSTQPGRIADRDRDSARWAGAAVTG